MAIIRDNQTGETGEIIPECPPCRNKIHAEDMKKQAQEQIDKLDSSVRQEWELESNVPPYFLNKTFNNFDSKKQPQAFKMVFGYKNNSMLLMSPPGVYGVGKTHLVCALINTLVHVRPVASIFEPNCYVITHRCPARMESEPDMIEIIRDAFHSRDSANAGSTESVIKQLNGVPLLVVDDVGKRSPADLTFLQDIYYRIINYRYEHCKPLIMTTNLSYAEFEGHIGGANARRFSEMIGDNSVIMRR